MIDYNSSEASISWFRAQYFAGNLQIKPPYQRKPVWADRQKSSLIESILKEYPVPEIYIQVITKPDGEETYAVVDGQQRIRTVLQFLGAEKDPKELDSNNFALNKLEDESEYKDKSFSDLSSGEKSKLFAYRFGIRYLRTNDDSEIKDLFRRLNKYLAPLKPQELRNAKYSGRFSSLSNALADLDYWADNRIITPASIRRMGDVEFMSELLIGIMHGPQGGAASVIDEYYARYEDYDDEFPDERDTTKLFHETVEVLESVFPNIKTTRWSNKSDFYSLFVAISQSLRVGGFDRARSHELHDLLVELGDQISARLKDEDASVVKYVADYVKAVEKGANDRARRAERHRILLGVIAEFFGGVK